MKMLLISHGKMAEGALDTLRIFTQAADITAISAYTDGNDNPGTEVTAFFEKAGKERVIAFSDIVFGSVNQLLFPYLERPETYVFSGFNLPMLLQATTLSDESAPEEIAAIAEEGRSGVVDMKYYNTGTDDEDE